MTTLIALAFAATPLGLMFAYLNRHPFVPHIYPAHEDRDFAQVVRCIAEGDVIGAHVWAGEVASRCYWRTSEVYFAARRVVKGWR